ncbi:MAG: hypothetical protein VX181_11145, partial [Pseudomonadota bacterium]|nr:hypothetical protein [Pseudomonadota bacterium]
MVELRHDSILAVDGGGTRCRLVLCAGAAGRWSVEMGSANVSSDFDGAATQIRAGLTALAAESGTSEEALRDVPAYLGLAGITGPALAERLQPRRPQLKLTLTTTSSERLAQLSPLADRVELCDATDPVQLLAAL